MTIITATAVMWALGSLRIIVDHVQLHHDVPWWITATHIVFWPVIAVFMGFVIAWEIVTGWFER